MSNYIESKANLNGNDYVLRRKSLGCYIVYFNNMIVFEEMTKDSENYNDDTNAIIKHIKKLTKEEREISANTMIKELDNSSLNIGSDEIKVMIDRRLNMKMKLIGTTKKQFINEAIAEKLEKEGLL